MTDRAPLPPPAASQGQERGESIWHPDEWVCSHYQRSHFADDLDVWEHLGHCYVDYPGYWDYLAEGAQR